MIKPQKSLSSLSTVRTFMKTGTCSETVMSVVDGAAGYAQLAEEHASNPLAGGLAGMGFQCGQLWGAALAAGALAYREMGPGPQAEAAALSAAETLVQLFNRRYHCINCSDLTQVEWRKGGQGRPLIGFFLRGGPLRCFGMSADYARAAFYAIHRDLADGPFAQAGQQWTGPVSCAALLARRSGATEMQTVMAAGLAGGIGLSGGACGALGAAVWLRALRTNARRGEQIDFNHPVITDLVDRFVEASQIRFDCAEIVGRKFADRADHAAYLRAGGCAQLLDALAQPE